MSKIPLVISIAAVVLGFSFAAAQQKPGPQQEEQQEKPPAEEPIDEDLEAKVHKLLEEMASEEYKEREKGTKELQALLKESAESEKALAAHLRKRLKESEDPEVKYRLERVLGIHFEPWKYYRKLRTLKGHTETVYSVAFSPDGKLLASGNADKTVRIWDPRTGKRVRTLKGHTARVQSVAFSPDGKLLVSAGSDSTILLWDSGKGKVVRKIEGHEKEVLSISFSPDGKLIASGSADGTARMWDVNTGACTATFKASKEWVTAIAFSPDGKLLASGDSDGHVKIWDLKTGKCLHTLAKHHEGAWSVAFSPDGKLLASASLDNTVRTWDPKTGKQLWKFDARSEGLWDCLFALAFSPDKPWLLTACVDTLLILNPKTGECIGKLNTQTRPIFSASFSPDGKILAAATGVAIPDRRSDDERTHGKPEIQLWGIPEK